MLATLFEVLNTPENQRATTLDEELASFPYINGDLFSERLQIFAFDSVLRTALLEACHFDWSKISPAIFGALFQSVMDPEERREVGAHYTTEKNILKVIEPLFLENLKDEFERIMAQRRGRSSALREFQKKLGELRFLDPACGCGNFLIIAYRELRLLELDVVRELLNTPDRPLGVDWYTIVNVNQFYGIELGEFPALIAETAMWMMDHIMNNRLSLEVGIVVARIPLTTSPHIVKGDALEIPWKSLVSASDCSYILGNPPFRGAKNQSEEQRSAVRDLAALGGSGGSLDYVSAWFIKAGEYIQESTTRIGFVATNSITQGEQVGQLWSILFNRFNLVITFAHRTFAWGSDAKGMAHVHVVVIGLANQGQEANIKTLYNYPDINGNPYVTSHIQLSPYLIDASVMHNPHLVVSEESSPINGLPKLLSGSQPIDNGNYVMTNSERANFLDIEPEADHWIRPYIGAKEHLQGGRRWILALQDTPPQTLAQLPLVRQRIAAVAEFRKKSTRSSTKNLAPLSWQVEVIPTSPFLVIPETSSERREYVPIGWLEPPTIPSNATKILENATLEDFALLSSAMHMAWLRYVGGRLKNDFRYSIGLVYNTFPLPPDGTNLSKLKPFSQGVLDARATHKNASLANFMTQSRCQAISVKHMLHSTEP